MGFNLDFEYRTQCNILSEAVDSFLSYLEGEITMVEKPITSYGVSVPEIVVDLGRVETPYSYRPAWSET